MTNLADEGLYGHPVQILDEDGDWLLILSAYGYSGWCHRDTLQIVEREKLEKWVQESVTLHGKCVDVLSAPTVHASRLAALSGGSMVRSLEKEVDGWLQVALLDGSSGYAALCRTMPTRLDTSILFDEPHKWQAAQNEASQRRQYAQGGQENFSFRNLLDKFYAGSEQRFRDELTDLAKSYLGTQYRWGGRSSFGIDCSGLVGSCYQQCGVMIYRDAAIVDGYPLKRLPLIWENGRISRDSFTTVLKAGDALYFPGHVAMYLENGQYIHATGHCASNGVVISSLCQEDGNFRQDLYDSLYAAAGLRLPEQAEAGKETDR